MLSASLLLLLLAEPLFVDMANVFTASPPNLLLGLLSPGMAILPSCDCGQVENVHGLVKRKMDTATHGAWRKSPISAPNVA